ncbi:hypothetical protein KC358_g48 [Hortaea werneckii]|nr:hypothetical protein KC358_g48 [Hortaea werneckii]
MRVHIKPSTIFLLPSTISSAPMLDLEEVDEDDAIGEVGDNVVYLYVSREGLATDHLVATIHRKKQSNNIPESVAEASEAFTVVATSASAAF